MHRHVCTEAWVGLQVYIFIWFLWIWVSVSRLLHLIFIRLCMYECTTHYVSRVASSKLSGI